MNFLLAVAAALLSLAFLALIFIPMEKAFPARNPQQVFRPAWFLDLCFFLGQYLLWGGVVVYLLSYFAQWLDYQIPYSFRQSIGTQPIWLQSIEVIIGSDLLIYWGHRLQHRVEFLWRFHKVHHTSEHLDWLAAHREHPLDSIYTVGLINLPAIILGFNLDVLAGVIAFRGIWAIYIHSNVRLPLPWLRTVIGAPELHHWHHDKDRDAGNYANISPLMDVLFGTYVCPDHEPQSFGIHESFPRNYIGQLMEPILGKRIWKKISSRKQRQ